MATDRRISTWKIKEKLKENNNDDEKIKNQTLIQK